MRGLVLALAAGGLALAASALREEAAAEPERCAEARLFPKLVAHPTNKRWAAPEVEVSCADDTLTVRSNGIPSYAFVAVTPNGLSEQRWRWTIPRSPERAAAPRDIPLLGTAGFALNGLPIYGPNEAQFPDPYGDPVYNAILDKCLGHTGGRADYHYHALLVACVLGQDAPEDQPSPVVGFAMDGFPIYGPKGCRDAACSEVVEYRSSWRQVGDPRTYAWDKHVYEAQDDPLALDRCNGHVGPGGDYHYHATATFPYVLGCYAGTPLAGSGLGGDPGGGDPGGGARRGPPGGQREPPSCDVVPPGRPCCGDGICGGPETEDNCADDC